MIVTLAGHVDHGKTTLVRLLTGKDTDRLEEEKRRGLTIDLGFAYLQDGARTTGFVDVPGHHRFIHNMVAGVAARQHALLVIAADDGPMPQSGEHLQILELIGVSRGTIALSKCDRADPARIAATREQIAGLVAGSFLEDAPIFETAATGEGIPELRTRLLGAAAEGRPAAHTGSFRLAVDRAFTLKGTGVVVTGTVHAGSLRMHDELFVFPGNTPVRVRGLHVQNQPAENAESGDRAAINIAGVEASAVGRGHWLTAHPDPGHDSAVLDLRVLADYPRPVRHWTPVHVYHATRHTTARLALLEGSRAEPGETVRAELEFDEPMLVKHGDRLVIRDHGLDRTLGGGSVIDNRRRAGRRRASARLAAVAAYGSATPARALDDLLDAGPVDEAAFQGVWDLPPDEVDALVAAREVTRHGTDLVSDALWRTWQHLLGEECSRRHAAARTLQGLRENDFEADVPERFRGDVLAGLVSAGILEQRAGRFRPAQHQVELSSQERELLERLTPLLDVAQPPSLGDIGKTLRIPLTTLQAQAKTLASKGALVRVNDKRIYLSERLAALAATAEALSAEGEFTARAYRDAAGIGRNVAIDVLEYFDARGFTRRLNDLRRVVGERSRVIPGPL